MDRLHSWCCVLVKGSSKGHRWGRPSVGAPPRQTPVVLLFESFVSCSEATAPNLVCFSSIPSSCYFFGCKLKHNPHTLASRFPSSACDHHGRSACSQGVLSVLCAVVQVLYYVAKIPAKAVVEGLLIPRVPADTIDAVSTHLD